MYAENPASGAPSAAHIFMLAAENDALPGGKVGGIGDVIRDVAPALGARGLRVTVATPSYGVFASLPGASKRGTVNVRFGSAGEAVDVYEVPHPASAPGVTLLVFEHPRFSACGRGRIYCDDPADSPFATDASKFALFCVAVAEWLLLQASDDEPVLHLHDWHAALLAPLLRHAPRYRALSKLRRVYSIHNLALQGVRPLAGHASSPGEWLPGVQFPAADVADPRWPDCINLMAAGIRNCDAIHVVSPTYAEEVQRSSDIAGRGFHGGEGLHEDLTAVAREGRLFGILNGLAYTGTAAAPVPGWRELLASAKREVLRLASAETMLASAHFVAAQRIDAMAASPRPGMLLSSISRLTAQKAQLLRQPCSDGRPALHVILDELQGRGAYMVIGSGDPAIEAFLADACATHRNFLFVRGYSERLGQQLYAAGDLFLMPSSFEPCGIGQMLAMRHAQPCLVNDVGGLHDTVEDGVTGFVFGARNPVAQADALVSRACDAMRLYAERRTDYERIREAAGARRFDWSASIDAYIRDLYALPLRVSRS